MTKKHYLYMIFAMALTALGCAGCSSDNDSPLNEDAPSSYYFELEITDTGRDQAAMILTTIEYVDYKGNTVTDTYNDAGDESYLLTSHEYTKMPANCTVVITQSLRSGISYDKEIYALGLKAQLRVTSLNLAGNIIASRLSEFETSQNIKTENLGKAFPKTEKFTFSVGKDGSITLK